MNQKKQPLFDLISVAELEDIIRETIQPKIEKSMSHYERHININQFGAWLKGNRSYSQNTQVKILDYFQTPIYIEINHQKYQLYAPKKA